MKSRYPFILIAVIFVFCITTFMASMVEARRGGGGGGRGGRGGGGFSRGGPAASGGFSSRPAGHSRVSQTSRQEIRREQPREQNSNLDDRQERRDEIRENRQDLTPGQRAVRREAIDDRRDDYYDDHYHYGGVAYVTYAPCSTTVVVNGSTYYHCSSTWYSRGYEGGSVVYVVTSAPAGY